MFSSVEQVREALISVGYITDEVTTTSVFLAAHLQKPVLLEGPPGSGKTELAYAVAKATDAEVERLQCYEGINEEKAIGKFDESLQRLWVELLSKSGNLNWETVKQEIHGEQFFSAGPLLRALRHEKRCVLLIDELDKVDHAFEAQAFKRSCSCFGLGRYLYYFEGMWVDLDARKRPKTVPKLPKWATPAGWQQGLRPGTNGAATKAPGENGAATNKPSHDGSGFKAMQTNATVRQIESLEKKLGKKIYHGLLRDLARVWVPTQIGDPATQEKVLKHMQAAERGFQRVDAALEKVGKEPLIAVLKSLNIKTLEQVADLETLHKIVLALEAKAGLAPHRA